MADQPNVIVILCDQMKATASHLYGNPFCETPSLERLAREGTLFEHAITPHPLCAPARVSLWTSQYPHQHGGRRNQTLMPEGATHAFWLWKNAGYHVGLIGKNHCFDREEDLALFDTWCEIGHGGLSKGEVTRGMDWFRPVESIDACHAGRRNLPNGNSRFTYGVTDFPLGDYTSGLVAGQTARFLEEHQDEPFALWVSFPDPHEPWECPREYADLFSRDAVELPPWRDDEFTDGTAPERNRILYEMLGVRDDPMEQVLDVVGVYHAMTRFVDDSVGQILDALERLHLRENTIVVFCSDHGDFMGEHAMQCKGGAFYDCLTRVVSWPSHVITGVRDDSMVSLLDIVPTLFDLQGIDIPRSMQGELLPTVTETVPRDAAFSEYGAGGPAFRMTDLEQMEKPWGRKTLIESLQWREAEGRRKMVRTRDWKYVHDPTEGSSEDELYDLKNDPWELSNVVGEPANGSVLADSRLRLADWSIGAEDGEPVPLPELGD